MQCFHTRISLIFYDSPVREAGQILSSQLDGCGTRSSERDLSATSQLVNGVSDSCHVHEVPSLRGGISNCFRLGPQTMHSCYFVLLKFPLPCYDYGVKPWTVGLEEVQGTEDRRGRMSLTQSTLVRTWYLVSVQFSQRIQMSLIRLLSICGICLMCVCVCFLNSHTIYHPFKVYKSMFFNYPQGCATITTI